jgi:hypothetical protein
LGRDDVAKDAVAFEAAEVDVEDFGGLDRAVGLNVEAEVEAFDDPVLGGRRPRDGQQEGANQGDEREATHPKASYCRGD